jgi:hypothetical protein
VSVRNLVNVLVLGLVLLLGACVAIAGIAKVRQAAGRALCANNLRSIGLALRDYNDCMQSGFPPGTVPNAALPPEKRLSWLTLIWPDYMAGGCKSLLDKGTSWDADVNCPPRWRRRGRPGEETMGDVLVFLCPANPARNGPTLPSPTDYVGIGGLGDRAAELPASDLGAGVFGYDRQTKMEDINDGTSHTLLIMETALDNGPWTAGGPPTVRGLDSSRQPYLGPGQQFGGTHPGLTGTVFADGSVHFLRNSINSNVLEALATVAGGEDVPAFTDP